VASPHRRRRRGGRVLVLRWPAAAGLPGPGGRCARQSGPDGAPGWVGVSMVETALINTDLWLLTLRVRGPGFEPAYVYCQQGRQVISHRLGGMIAVSSQPGRARPSPTPCSPAPPAVSAIEDPSTWQLAFSSSLAHPPTQPPHFFSCPFVFRQLSGAAAGCAAVFGCTGPARARAPAALRKPGRLCSAGVMSDRGGLGGVEGRLDTCTCYARL
jgi:hypothetical protein